jgi:hypothetical protein
LQVPWHIRHRKRYRRRCVYARRSRCHVCMTGRGGRCCQQRSRCSCKNTTTKNKKNQQSRNGNTLQVCTSNASNGQRRSSGPSPRRTRGTGTHCERCCCGIGRHTGALKGHPLFPVACRLFRNSWSLRSSRPLPLLFPTVVVFHPRCGVDWFSRKVHVRSPALT